MQPRKTIASKLVPGDIVVKTGATLRVGTSAITVTEVQSNAPLSPTVRVFGFDGRNSTPRLMFRALNARLNVVVDDERAPNSEFVRAVVDTLNGNRE